MTYSVDTSQPLFQILLSFPSGLMDKVDFVTLLSAELLKDAPEGSTFASMIMGTEYGTILGESLGIDMTTEAGVQEFMTTVGGLVDQKMDLLIASGKYAEESPT